MKIEIKLDELRKNRLFIGMPTYGGMMCTMTAKCLIDLNSMLTQYGIESKFSFLMNESLIQRARNYMTDEFMRSDCTHMMFIDSDIVFDPKDILAMLALDKEIIGGSYCKKSIEWNQIYKAIQKNPNLPASEYEKIAGSIVFNPVANMTKFSVSEPVEVMEVGTGFCLYKREVFDKFREAYPEYMYKPDHQNTEFFNSNREICSYFNVFIDPETKRTWSEDYANCQMMRKIGVKIWMAPFVVLQHVGTHIFQGSLPAIAQHIGEL